MEVDRAAAIAFAVLRHTRRHGTDSRQGHETYQEVAGVRSPFSDADCAAAQLLQRRPPNGAVALKTLAEETGGELIGASVSLSRLALDSRHVGKGDLFAASRDPRLTA
ncbi:MAG: hypothetical protein CM15mP74_01380 [Halieaceae bacterium]|nr:MAG: hypothetical protein CM15mP74_01380 [Halieaceae bacterium]